jgi:rod shape-determining protein MreC
LPLVFYVSNNKDAREHNAFDRAVLFVSAPVQWLVVAALDSLSSTWDRYIALVDVEAENETLRKDNERLSAALAQREEQRLENERLHYLLGLRDRSPEEHTLFARVIAISPTPLFRSVRIDRGSDDRVHVGAAVVSNSGVIGRVGAVGADWADVMLLVDANSSTDVLVQRTRARARVRGVGGDRDLGIKVEYLGRTEDVAPGDILITSGAGKIFPKGLRVGRVTSVERGAFGLYQAATVEPSADFRRLEEVMILLSGWPAETSFEADPDPVAPPPAPEPTPAPPVAGAPAP